jgi:hypothetical protein
MRTYRRGRARLLFWSALCFFFLAVGNILLFIDLIILPDYDLSVVRDCVTLAALAMLLYGLVWETR